MGALTVGRGTDDGVRRRPAHRRPTSAARSRSWSTTRSPRAPRALVGGTPRPTAPGYFYPPTVLAGVRRRRRLRREEIFGPVAPVFTFDSEDEAIAAANDTEFGLVAYVFTAT